MHGMEPDADLPQFHPHHVQHRSVVAHAAANPMTNTSSIILEDRARSEEGSSKSQQGATGVDRDASKPHAIQKDQLHPKDQRQDQDVTRKWTAVRAIENRETKRKCGRGSWRRQKSNMRTEKGC